MSDYPTATKPKRYSQKASGFTLMEVLIAIAVLGVAFVAALGLQSQAMVVVERLSQRMQTQLWADDLYTRARLKEMGYNVEDLHPVMKEKQQDWSYTTELIALGEEEFPFLPLLPPGWQVDWIHIEIRDAQDTILLDQRQLWSHQVAASQFGQATTNETNTVEP